MEGTCRLTDKWRSEVFLAGKPAGWRKFTLLGLALTARADAVVQVLLEFKPDLEAPCTERARKKDSCAVCTKPMGPEVLRRGDVWLHTKCFRCNICDCPLSSDSYHETNSVFFCEPTAMQRRWIDWIPNTSGVMATR